MKKWTSHSGYTPIWLNPEMKVKLRDLTPGSVIDATSYTVGNMVRVIYQDVIGWVDVGNIEDYLENFPRDCVDIKAIQTPNTLDAEQYILWDQKRQVNMCGELSICYTLNIGLAQLLERWQAAKPTLWNQIFSSGIARGTNPAQLVQIYGLFGVQASTLQFKAYTPMKVACMNGAIVSVKIDGITGRLSGKGKVLHWVVITGSMPERLGYGLVYVYNSYSNRIEVYSWAEFAAAAGTPYGVNSIDASYQQVTRDDGQPPYQPVPAPGNA